MSRERRLSLGLLVLLGGCGKGGDKASAASEASQPIIAAVVPAAGDTSCPNTGLWARCSVFKSLERAGLNTHADSAQVIVEKPLVVPAVEIPIARGHIRIFLYADSNSRRRDAAKLDRKQFILAVQEPGFARERTLIENANLLVLMDVARSLNRERIANALMAGPPQPPSKQP
jgi:hypothetical protein